MPRLIASYAKSLDVNQPSSFPLFILSAYSEDGHEYKHTSPTLIGAYLFILKLCE